MTDKKKEIYRCAKEIFSAKGFKETNVTDITKMAGIAAGTFYNYYTSKDQLFMEIYIEENVKLKQYIMDSVDFEGDPIDVTREMMFLNDRGIRANPILREWYNRDVFSKIERKYREENGMEHIRFMYDVFIEVVKKWQDEGKMRKDIDAEMIMAIFGALINIDLHKEEIGLQYFPLVLDHMMKFVMNALTEIKN
jgi:AcrR family transcriptional regulator